MQVSTSRFSHSVCLKQGTPPLTVGWGKASERTHLQPAWTSGNPLNTVGVRRCPDSQAGLEVTLGGLGVTCSDRQGPLSASMWAGLELTLLKSEVSCCLRTYPNNGGIGRNLGKQFFTWEIVTTAIRILNIRHAQRCVATPAGDVWFTNALK